MKTTFKVVVAMLGLAVAGCASVSGFPDRPENVKATLENLQKRYFLPGTDVLEEYKKQNTAEEKRGYRNAVIYGQMQAIDIRFSEFQEALYKEGIITNLSLDILGIGVGAAGATVIGGNTSRILSAVSAGIAGTQTAFNKNVYYERTMPALLALMEAERAKIRNQIEQSLLLSVEDYPIEKSLGDIGRYFNAGSIPGSIVVLTQDAGKAKQEAEDALKTTRDALFVNVASQKRVQAALELVDKLPAGKAVDILDNPPSPLDDFVAKGVQGRLGGNALGTAGANAILKAPAGADDARVKQADQNAREILKYILVMIQNRSAENIGKWTAAMTALIPAQGGDK